MIVYRTDYGSHFATHSLRRSSIIRLGVSSSQFVERFHPRDTTPDLPEILVRVEWIPEASWSIVREDYDPW